MRLSVPPASIRLAGSRGAVHSITFGQSPPSHGDEAKKDDGADQAALFSETQLALKPGPMAVITERDGNPARSVWSRTNSAVGADIFPYS